MTQNAVSRLVTERTRGAQSVILDETLARVARLEIALAASGGTLHDVNNLLTVLSGNLYLLTESLRKRPEALEQCRSARDTAQRAAALIRELLAFAGAPDEAESSLHPAALIDRLQPVLRRSIGDAHDFLVRADPETWRVSVSVAQLESAIANLVLNAKEALTGSGRIEIETANVPATAELPDGLGRSDHVRLAVQDDGAGIPAELLARVTEPLYTSKPHGQGSGLGLTMVTRFARSAGGTLTIESSRSQGTRVSIWLPRASDTAVTASLTMPISTLPSGDEQILVVASDEGTTSTLRQLLEALGYTVSTAKNPSEADTVLMSRPGIVLIIGAESLLNPDWRQAGCGATRKVLVLADPGVMRDTTPIGDATLLTPVSVPELAQSVRRLLDGGAR